jgi:hypothetical protein
MNFNQLKELVVEPTLHYLDPVIPYSEEAVDLLMMTACHESLCGEYIAQVNGPALGIYQMEPDTYKDIHLNFIGYRAPLAGRISILSSWDIQGAASLTVNLTYATAMARVLYYRVPRPLPVREGQSRRAYLEALALYCKEHYNTHLGKATPEEYLNDYLRFSGETLD